MTDTTALRSLLAEATPAPWYANITPTGPSAAVMRSECVMAGNDRVAARGDQKKQRQWIQDAALIVALRNAAPAMLDEIDSLRRERDVLLEEVNAMRERDGVRSLIVQGGGTYCESLDEKARLKAFRATDAIGGEP